MTRIENKPVGDNVQGKIARLSGEVAALRVYIAAKPADTLAESRKPMVGVPDEFR